MGKSSPTANVIAATAIKHHVLLATRKVRDAMGCGVRVLNPSDGY